MLVDPVFIIGCPRSGTTLLYHILSEASELWSLGYESKAILERWHHPRVKGWESGALEATDLTPHSAAAIRHAFERQSAPGAFWRRVHRLQAALRRQTFYQAIKRRGRSDQAGAGVSYAVPQQGLRLIRWGAQAWNRATHRPGRPIRLLEKTPENCLRLPFLLALFPEARFVYVTRDGRDNIHSLMEGWRHPHAFPGYAVPATVRIPGDVRGRWAFTLIPGWRELLDRPLEEVCAWQWRRCNEAVLAHQATPAARERYFQLRYEDWIAAPTIWLPRLASFLHLDYTKELTTLATELPEINVVSTPGRRKWEQSNRPAIERILPLIQPLQEQLGYTQ